MARSSSGLNAKADFSLIIGLDTSALFAGMDEANTTISNAISRINSESKQISIKMDTDVIKAGTDEFKKQEIELAALNKQLDLQRAKLTLLGQARDSAYKNTGKDSATSRGMNTRYLQQERYVAQLNAQLKQMQAEAAKAGTASSGLFSKIKSGASTAKSSMSELTGAYGTLSTKLAGLTALAVAGGGLFNITDSAMKSGEAIYQLSKRLQMTTGEAASFKRTFDMVGADVNSVVPFFARLNKSITTAGASGNATTLALAKFGVTLTDSTGKLLPMNQELAALANGYQKAAASGREAEFTSQILGARGAALVPILEQYNDLMEAASRVKTTGLMNPQEAHETYIEWMALKMEAGQLSNAFGAAMLPVAKELMPDIEDGIGNLVSIIRDNKGEITSTVKEWASMFGELAKGAGEAAKTVADVHAAVNGAKDVKGEDGNPTRITDKDRLKYLYGDKNVEANYQAMDGLKKLNSAIGGGLGFYVGRSKYSAALGASAGYGATSAVEWLDEKALLAGHDTDEIDKQVAYQKQRKELAEQEQKAFASLNEQIKKSTEANGQNSSSTNANATAQQKAIDAVEKRKTAIGQLTEEIYKLTHSDYENSMHSMKNKVEELTAAGIPQPDIDKYVSAYQADLQRSMKTGLLNPISDAIKTDLQKSLDDIDRQAEEMRHKWAGSGHEGDIDAWARQRKSQITSDWDKQVASQIDSIWKSSYDKRLDEIEREKQAWVKKGLDEVKATKWAEESKRRAMQETAQGMFTSNKKYYRAWKAAGGIGSGQAGIDAIANQMRREQGIPKSAFTTPGEIQAFESAMNSAKSNLVPIISDGTYQGTKAAMIEVLRGTNMTNESGIMSQQPTFDVNAPSIDFTPLVSAIDTAAAQQRETMEIIRGTMTQTIDIASSSADAELSSYKLWTEQEAQQILQAADHTTAAFTSGETWFNQLGEEIKRNTDATDEQTKAMMDTATQALANDYGGGKDPSDAIDKVSGIMEKQERGSMQAAQDIVRALNQTSLETRKQIQDFQAAQQKVRHEIYRTTNIYPRELTTEQITEIANTVYGRGMEEIEGTSAQNSY